MNNRRDYNRAPMVTAHHFLLLCKKVDIQKAGDLLGVGYSTVSRYKSTEKVPKAIEKASELEMLKRASNANLPAKAPDEIVILKVPQDKMEYLQMFLKGAEIKSARFRDN